MWILMVTSVQREISLALFLHRGIIGMAQHMPLRKGVRFAEAAEETRLIAQCCVCGL
jgi:hypothetical protein